MICKTPKLNVFKILKKTSAEGPGQRFCIWVQGCSLKCSGCFAKATWSHKENILYSVDELFSLIEEMKNQIEGVTFLGGEPFEQAEALSVLAGKVKSIGLSVVTFSGNTYESLKVKGDMNIDSLLSNTDLLIDGPFVQEEIDYSRPWVGSSNQKYRFLTDRYSLKDILMAHNKVEIRINRNGSFFANGMGDFRQLEDTLCLQVKENNL